MDLTCAMLGTAASSYDSTSRDAGSNRAGKHAPAPGWVVWIAVKTSVCRGDGYGFVLAERACYQAGLLRGRKPRVCLALCRRDSRARKSMAKVEENC
jgi:hypothetical protein